jgi:hypothetical protein
MVLEEAGGELLTALLLAEPNPWDTQSFRHVKVSEDGHHAWDRGYMVMSVASRICWCPLPTSSIPLLLRIASVTVVYGSSE